MIDLIATAENIKKVDPVALIKKVLKKPRVQSFIINLNTEDQLKKDNINPDGVKLYQIGKPYSAATLAIKGINDPTKITLFDTGDYYDTFDILILPNGDFEIISNNEIHGSDTLLAKEEWGKVEGLTQENEIKAKTLIEEEAIKELEQYIVVF